MAKRVTFDVPPEMHKALRMRAVELGLPLSDIMRQVSTLLLAGLIDLERTGDKPTRVVERFDIGREAGE